VPSATTAVTEQERPDREADEALRRRLRALIGGDDHDGDGTGNGGFDDQAPVDGNGALAEDEPEA
ncbi:MAG: hypothetical protein NZM94_03020, partial [Roseiflexus sp.]|nr:hypothetical protein [Roseiflexus sp.]